MLFLLLLIGFVMLGGGAELMVSGSSKLAIKLGVSPLIVGLTIVAFGTSAPELAVSIQSTNAGSSGLALGNVIGSNIANIGLILGITALLRPIRIEHDLVKKQIPLVIASTLILGLLLLLDQELDFSDGLLLTAALLIYLYVNSRQSNSAFETQELTINTEIARKDVGATLKSSIWIILGLVLLISGSQLFVNSAVEIAQAMGSSEAIIGLTLVAIGTSVPELATSLIATIRNEADIAIGNVIGSNIFNVLCVLGITAVVGTVYGADIALIDFVVMVAFSVIPITICLDQFHFKSLGRLVLTPCLLSLSFLCQLNGIVYDKL